MTTNARLARLEDLAQDIPDNPHCWTAEGLACYARLMRWAGASAETIAAGVELRRRGDWRTTKPEPPAGETGDKIRARLRAELEAIAKGDL